MSKLGIRCPQCGTPTGVLYSAETYDGKAVRRRRQCPGCGERLTTYEQYDPAPRNKPRLRHK